MKKIEIYTDGACRGNPGPGGWGAVLVYNGKEKEISGGEPLTTNNRMELTAVIEALSALKEPCEVTLCSDSKYVLDALRFGWAQEWRATEWKRGKAKNPDLWEKLLHLIDIHKMHYIWVKGHEGHAYNERCDALAVAESKKFSFENEITKSVTDSEGLT